MQDAPEWSPADLAIIRRAASIAVREKGGTIECPVDKATLRLRNAVAVFGGPEHQADVECPRCRRSAQFSDL